ncbi:MAG: DUF4142 domain-containing protein [Terracidiphilus sp.]
MSFLRLSEYLPLIAAAALLAGETGAAQQNGAGRTANLPDQQTMASEEANGSDASSQGAPGAGDWIPLTFVDQVFLRRTLQNGRVQVELERLAALKASSADVKQFGRNMARTRAQLDSQLRPMAERLGVWTPRKSSKKERQVIAKLRTLSGPDFDAAFIEAMLKREESDLKRFKSEMEDGHDPTVQQVAKMDEPALSEHMQTLEQLAQSHNVAVESKK